MVKSAISMAIFNSKLFDYVCLPVGKQLVSLPKQEHSCVAQQSVERICGARIIGDIPDRLLA